MTTTTELQLRLRQLGECLHQAEAACAVARQEAHRLRGVLVDAQKAIDRYIAGELNELPLFAQDDTTPEKSDCDALNPGAYGPACFRCRSRGGNQVDLPSQAGEEDDLIPCDQVDAEVLRRAGLIPGQASDDEWLCGKCHGYLGAEGMAPPRKPKKVRQRKAKAPSLAAQAVHHHFCPAGPQAPLATENDLTASVPLPVPPLRVPASEVHSEGATAPPGYILCAACRHTGLNPNKPPGPVGSPSTCPICCGAGCIPDPLAAPLTVLIDLPTMMLQRLAGCGYETVGQVVRADADGGEASTTTLVAAGLSVRDARQTMTAVRKWLAGM